MTPKALPYQKSSSHDTVLMGVVFLWGYSNQCVVHALVGDQRPVCIFTALTGLSELKNEGRETGGGGRGRSKGHKAKREMCWKGIQRGVKRKVGVDMIKINYTHV